MKKWTKTALLAIFVYIPGAVLVILGFSLFGLGISITAGLLLITNPEIRAWLHAKRGFRKRLSRLPLISLEPTKNNSILLTMYLLAISFISWLILGGTLITLPRIDLLLSLGGVVIFYGVFVEGWFVKYQDQYPEMEEDKLASLIPELTVQKILTFLKSNVVVAVALAGALLSPLLCVGTGELLQGDIGGSGEQEYAQQETAQKPTEDLEFATQTPYIIVVSPTAQPKTPTATATQTPSPVADQGRETALVVEITDGDTIRVVMDGVEYPVRYIGIDTPEIQNGEWFGQEARDANAELVEGKEVLLEKDESETDQYDRLLRYVFLIDGTFVNAELVRMGFAESKAYPPDTKYYDQLESLEQEARSAGLGLWQNPTSVAVDTTGTNIQIVAVDKRAEYVDIQNAGNQTVSIDGWILRSEKGNQDCRLGGSLAPGQVLRIWAMAEDSDQEGYNCRNNTNIWNNSDPDPAVLFNESFKEIDRYP